MGAIGCPETSLINNRHKPRGIPELARTCCFEKLGFSQASALLWYSEWKYTST